MEMALFSSFQQLLHAAKQYSYETNDLLDYSIPHRNPINLAAMTDDLSNLNLLMHFVEVLFS